MDCFPLVHIPISLSGLSRGIVDSARLVVVKQVHHAFMCLSQVVFLQLIVL